MTEACKRHKRGVLVGWLPIDNDRGTSWAIAEVWRCARCCRDMNPRLAKDTIRPTQKEAMQAYGLPQDVIDGFFPPAPPEPPSKRVEVPLTEWPFPVTTRGEIISARATADLVRRQKLLEEDLWHDLG